MGDLISIQLMDNLKKQVFFFKWESFTVKARSCNLKKQKLEGSYNMRQNILDEENNEKGASKLSKVEFREFQSMGESVEMDSCLAFPCQVEESEIPEKSFRDFQKKQSSTCSTSGISLEDYFDSDRLTGLVPCWLLKETQCLFHGKIEKEYPDIFFCLQVLDNLIVITQSKTAYLNYCFKVARACLSNYYQQKRVDIRLNSYSSSKSFLVGIPVFVWVILDYFYKRVKINVCPSSALSMGNPIRLASIQSLQYLHILMTSEINAPKKSKHLPACHKAYLENNSNILAFYSATKPIRFPAEVSSFEWKIGFQALEIHLKSANPNYRLYPCGSFSRGAVYGHIIDVVVSCPIEHKHSCIRELENVLVETKICKDFEVFSIDRGFCIAYLHGNHLLLDVKVHHTPRLWFALTYFTGPESFVLRFFTELMSQSPVKKVNNKVLSFDSFYNEIMCKYEQKIESEIHSEDNVFNLCNWAYVKPSHRI